MFFYFLDSSSFCVKNSTWRKATEFAPLLMPDEVVAILVTKDFPVWYGLPANQRIGSWFKILKHVGQNHRVTMIVFVFSWTVHRLYNQKKIIETFSQSHGLQATLCRSIYYRWVPEDTRESYLPKVPNRWPSDSLWGWALVDVLLEVANGYHILIPGSYKLLSCP